MATDICITTYRNTKKLEKCLASVLEKTKFADYKILLWCNDPNDEVKKIVHDSMFVDGVRFTDRIEPIFNDNNDGSFAFNNNAVAKEGSAEYILFLNDDVSPINDGWLHNMQKILDTDEKVGVVGSLLLYPDNTIQHCGVFFSHRTNNLPYHMNHKQPFENVKNFVSLPRYYQAVTAACMLVRRKDFEAVGGFCEDYKYSFEDIDLCLKIKNQLYKNCVFCPDAKLTHDEGISKTQPHLEHNIAAFKKNCTGKYYNDLEFYSNNQRHLVYKYK